VKIFMQHMHKKLKRQTIKEQYRLAASIRKFLIKSLSKTGGHLASNLGVVELTLALHTVFNTAQDKLVWDVGHQAYIHKILTGRGGRFASLRQLGGISGFPKTSESEHDAFDTGHSSTAISAALGLATARDLQNASHKVVAIVGDGSMTGGLSFEGLNNAGRSKTDLLVVLNDNQMSISQNVGALSRHLNKLRTTSGYLGAKKDVRNLLNNVPAVGKKITRGIETAKNLVKYAILPGTLFEEMGFRYFGPIDGHNIRELTKVLEQTKKIKGPVMVHVLTKKGKGYPPAEAAPQNYHGIGKYNVETGEPAPPIGQKYTDIFAEKLCQLAAQDSSIVAVTAAMLDGTGLANFRTRYPTRFFDVGIAEGHAVTFAAGLAKGGLRPVVCIYSSFMQRAYDNILHDVALQNLPVVFALDRAGAVTGEGETHQGLYDLAYLSHIPNMTVLAPSNGAELAAMLEFALRHTGPVAIRYPSEAAFEYPHVPEIALGRAQTILQGKDIAIVSVGTMLETALDTAAILKENGINPSLYNARFVKSHNMGDSLQNYKYIFTIEDAAEKGGYGQSLRPSPTHAFAFPDSFIVTGTRQELFKRYRLNATAIAEQILQYMQYTKGDL